VPVFHCTREWSYSGVLHRDAVEQWRSPGRRAFKHRHTVRGGTHLPRLTNSVLGAVPLFAAAYSCDRIPSGSRPSPDRARAMLGRLSRLAAT